MQLVTPIGNIYEGMIVEGVKSGKFTCSNGNVYAGGFTGNQLTGFGTLFYSDGRIKTGQWANGTLVANFNDVADCCGKPPTTRASKMDVPEFGANFKFFTMKQYFCGPRAYVNNGHCLRNSIMMILQ